MLDMLFYLQVAGLFTAMLANVFTVVMAISLVAIAVKLSKKG